MGRTAQAVYDLNDQGKIGVFGIGDPLANREHVAKGSLRACLLWNEINQGKLVMYVAKLAYENKIHTGSTFTCPFGAFTVASAYGKVTGATKNTVIFPKPPEFTRSNRMKYDS